MAAAQNASDLILVNSKKPKIKKHSGLSTLEELPIVNNDFIDYIVQTYAPQKSYEHELDFSFLYKSQVVVRANMAVCTYGKFATLRIINNTIKSMPELRMPDIISSLLHKKQGLILITGPTDSGKSTSLAAMINYINQTECKNIITIEDPIEYRFQDIKSNVIQRELNIHTLDYDLALSAALRQNPDVIMVGEMRDLATIRLALRASATGHLVLSTLHTNSAAETINRIISMFPEHEQNITKNMLASTLLAIVSQRLVPRKNSILRIAAYEILLNNPAVRNLISENKLLQISSVIQTNLKQGMRLLADDLDSLKAQDLVAQDLSL